MTENAEQMEAALIHSQRGRELVDRMRADFTDIRDRRGIESTAACSNEEAYDFICECRHKIHEVLEGPEGAFFAAMFINTVSYTSLRLKELTEGGQ